MVNGKQDMVGCNRHEGGWMDGWMDGSTIQSQLLMLIARIAIRIMSDTRDEEKDRNKEQRSKIKGVLQDTQDPRNNCKIYYNTGNMSRLHKTVQGAQAHTVQVS